MLHLNDKMQCELTVTGHCMAAWLLPFSFEAEQY